MLFRALKSNPHIPTWKHVHLDLLSIRTIHTDVISLNGGRALIPRVWKLVPPSFLLRMPILRCRRTSWAFIGELKRYYITWYRRELHSHVHSLSSGIRRERLDTHVSAIHWIASRGTQKELVPSTDYWLGREWIWGMLPWEMWSWGYSSIWLMPLAVLEVHGVKMLTSPVGGRVRQKVLILMICENRIEARLKMILDLLFQRELFW